MNPNIKINRIFSFGLEKKRPNIKLKFKYKKNSLNNILRDINTIKHEIFDNKSNNIFNYDFNNFIQRPKTTSKRYNNNNNNFIFSDFSNENESKISKEDKNNKNKILKWNYSFFPGRNKIKLKRNLSCKKQRIINILNRKDPLIIEDWKKPRMIKILEKNSLIEEAIISKPWKFFPSNYNN